MINVLLKAPVMKRGRDESSLVDDDTPRDSLGDDYNGGKCSERVCLS